MNPRMIRAVMLFERGRILEAEVELRAALAEGEDLADAHALLGLCLLHAGVTDDADKEIGVALRLSPNNPYCHYARSLVMERGLRFERVFGRGIAPVDDAKARACLESARMARTLAPEHERYLIHLAHLHQVFLKWCESAALAEQALRENPNSVAATLVLARAFTNLHRKGEARSQILRALELSPEDSIAHADMGWTLLQTGDHQAARAFFEEAMRISANLDWAQEGALECAKYEYFHYRWLRRFLQWVENRHWLVAIAGGLLIAGLVFGSLTVFFVSIEPFLRARLGGRGMAWCYGLILIPAVLLFVFHDHLLLFLIRRQAAARTTTGTRSRSRAIQQIGMIAITFGSVLLIVLLGNLSNLGMALSCGLIPRGCSLLLAHNLFPSGQGRRAWLAYSILLLIVGTLGTITYRKQLGDWPPAAMFLLILLFLLPVAIAADAQKRKNAKIDHQRKLASLSKKTSHDQSRPRP